jgi:hypothetical protein
MTVTNKSKGGLKQRLIHATIEYWINFLSLAVFFVVFTWYRRLVLAEYNISYVHYGIGLVEAAVLAKIVLLGDVLHIGRRLDDLPLVFPTIYKAVVFGICVAVFGVFEHMVSGYVHGIGLAGGFHELLSKGSDELFARCLVTFFVFVPFFAFKQLERVLGETKIRALFFRRRAATESRGVN